MSSADPAFVERNFVSVKVFMKMPNNFVNTGMLADVFLEKDDRIFAAIFMADKLSPRIREHIGSVIG
jgi:hypothetical protein